MTKTAGNRVVLVLTMALAGGSWLAAGLVDSPGAASVRSEQTRTDPAEEGWLWSATNERTQSYVWADDSGAAQPSEPLDRDLSWDASLRLESPEQTKAQN